MKKLLLLLSLPFFLILQGCSETIPPGYMGVVIPKEGGIASYHTPGRATVWGYDKLVLIETASELKPANISVIMSDGTVDSEGASTNEIGMTMDFVLNIRYRANNDRQVISALIADTLLNTGSTVSIMGVDGIYNKYGNMVVGRVSREVLGQYTPEEVLKNLPDINKALESGIKEALNNSPLVVSSVSLGPITLPKVIRDRIDTNNDARLSMIQRSINQEIAETEEKNKATLADIRAKRELAEAKSLAAQNTQLGDSLSSELLEFRKIQLRELEIEMMRTSLSSGNATTVFIPYGQADSAGAQMRMYQK